MKLIAVYDRSAIMRYAHSIKTEFNSLGDSIRYAWAIARQQVRDELKQVCQLAAKALTAARDAARAKALRTVKAVKELVCRSVDIGEVVTTPQTAGEVTATFEISCSRRDVNACKGQRRYKRSSYFRPALNAAALSTAIKEYRNA